MANGKTGFLGSGASGYNDEWSNLVMLENFKTIRASSPPSLHWRLKDWTVELEEREEVTLHHK